MSSRYGLVLGKGYARLAAAELASLAFDAGEAMFNTLVANNATNGAGLHIVLGWRKPELPRKIRILGHRSVNQSLWGSVDYAAMAEGLGIITGRTQLSSSVAIKQPDLLRASDTHRSAGAILLPVDIETGSRYVSGELICSAASAEPELAEHIALTVAGLYVHFLMLQARES